MKKLLPLSLVFAVVFSGCYGSFSLTKKLHSWNGDIQGGKWAKEGVFLGAVILPAYFFATLADAIVLNSIEFWGGKNPVQAKAIKSIRSGDEQAVLSYAPETKRLRVDGFRNGRPTGTLVFEPGAEGMVARDAKGEVVMTAKTLADGRIALRQADGSLVGTYGPESLPVR